MKLPDITLLNAEESLAWEALQAAAICVLALTPVHPDEKSEAATHFHSLQVSVLARVAYAAEQRR